VLGSLRKELLPLVRYRVQPLGAARVGGVRQVLFLGGQGVRVGLRGPGQLRLPVLQAPELTSRGIQALLSLRDPVARRLAMPRIGADASQQLARLPRLACRAARSGNDQMTS